MSLKEDWERVDKAYNKIRYSTPFPRMHIFVRIEELRKANNKGIDFAIRRLYASKEYHERIRLYGAPSSKYPRNPLRVEHNGPFGYKEYHYALVGLPEYYPNRDDRKEESQEDE